jgi:hypothetical protein
MFFHVGDHSKLADFPNLFQGFHVEDYVKQHVSQVIQI